MSCPSHSVNWAPSPTLMLPADDRVADGLSVVWMEMADNGHTVTHANKTIRQRREWLRFDGDVVHQRSVSLEPGSRHVSQAGMIDVCTGTYTSCWVSCSVVYAADGRVDWQHGRTFTSQVSHEARGLYRGGVPTSSGLANLPSVGASQPLCGVRQWRPLTTMTKT